MPQDERRLVRLTALETEGDSLPSEFIIFFAGANDSDKGSVLFDDIAAKTVMEQYAKHGVDMHIDLEHLSLDTWSPNYLSDAMAWANLELRGGELWAVNVRWTTPGEARLRNKTQRYTSPAFYVDDVARVTRLVNVALTAFPATHNLPALVAANRLARRTNMNAETVKKLLDAIEAGDLETLKALAKDLVAEAASGEPPASGGTGDEEDAALSGAADDPPTEEQKALSAAVVELRSLTGKNSIGEMVAELKRWSETLGAAQKRQDELDLDSRRDLVGQLVKLGIEIPATAWEGDPKGRTPVARLMAEPLAELRNRVAKLSAAKPPPSSHTPPKGKPGTSELSVKEQEFCKRNNMTPEQFAEHKKNAVVRR